MDTGTLVVIVIAGVILMVFSIGLYSDYYREANYFLKTPIRVHRQRRIDNCNHVWRKADMKFTYDGVYYTYRCNTCKGKKRLHEDDREKFEEEFMTGWYEKVKLD